MPKTKGMTSLEVAIIVAIVLVIAIAVGWYLYTTFAAAGQQSGLIVQEAQVFSDGTVKLKVIPQGAGQVAIARIELAGVTIKDYGSTPKIVNGPVTIEEKATGLTLAVGQTVSGRVVLTNGAVALFTATVQPAGTTGGTGSGGGGSGGGGSGGGSSA